MSTTILTGDFRSVFTNGWFITSGNYTETLEDYRVYNQIENLQIQTDIDRETQYFHINGDLIPVSGIKKQFKRTLTYDSNTEWFYFEDPFPRLRARDNMSLIDFHKNMYRTLQILDSEIAYLPAYPDYILTEETESHVSDTKQSPKKIITYNTILSQPGKISAGPPLQGGGVKEIKKRVREQLFLDPMFRKDIDDPSDKLKYYKTEGQWFDNLVQFDLWTKTNSEADQFIEWYEDILDRYRGMFKELGMQEMVYHKRVRDDTLLKWKNKFTVRSLIYYFRTEKLKVTEIKPIKRINITAEMQINQLYPKERLIENEEKIIKKWLKSGGN